MQLEAEGWCVIEQCLPRPLLQAVRARCQARAEREPPERRASHRSVGALVSVLEDPHHLDLLDAPELWRALASHGLGDARFAGGYALSKAAGSPATFWHQDWYFWDDPASYRDSAPQLGALVYLDDTTPDTGALRVLPGSHRRLHPLHAVLREADIGALRRGDPSVAAALSHQPDERTIAVRAGDVVLLDARCLHAAHAHAGPSWRTVVTIWLVPRMDALGEPVRAFIAAGVAPPGSWDAASRARLSARLPTYAGSAPPAVLAAHPDPARLERPR